MPSPCLVDEYLELLINGDRRTCRTFFHSNVDRFETIAEVYHEMVWPAMERIDKLYREDQINQAAQQMATRINRCLSDQLQSRLPKCQSNGRRILIACADDEPEELGAQMLSDLFESNGWDVYFLGGGVPNDEILTLVGKLRPDILLVFGTKPTGVPNVRALIDLIRGVNATPTMNIMISGGVFNRAEGLWKEINADLFAPNAREALPIAETAPPRKAEMRIPGAPKKRRRRRRPALLATAE